MTAWARRQWFLIALVAVLVVGAWQHAGLAPLAEAIPRNALVAAIMLAMSAPLDLRRSLSGGTAIAAVLVAATVNMGLAGPLAWLAGKGLPEPLAIGLIVACLSPCTLASAAVWTRRGNGNEAVALAVTVITNLLSFIVLPAWAWVLIGQTRTVDAVPLAIRLLLIVVVPIAVGQLLRKPLLMRAWCDRHRKNLSFAAQLGLLCMVFVGAVRCGALLENPATRLGPFTWGKLVVLAAAVHLGLFGMAWASARGLGARPAESLPAGLAGSQKTLAVGITVAMDFGPLAILPMIVYHGLQLLIDTFLADWLRADPAEEPAQTAESADQPA